MATFKYTNIDWAHYKASGLSLRRISHEVGCTIHTAAAYLRRAPGVKGRGHPMASYTMSGELLRGTVQHNPVLLSGGVSK